MAASGPGGWGEVGGSEGMGPFAGTSNQNKERQDRKKQLDQFTPLLRRGQMYEMPVDEMIGIMKMYKEEGNDLFKERNYTAAGEYYTHAIALACNMERKEGKPIETELISSVFCNRAACLHKMDYYEDAINNCNMGLALNSDNIEAYYRKASALKILREYKFALIAAEEGQRRAEWKDRKSDVKEFSELLREIKSHLGDVDKYREAALKSDKFTTWSAKWPARPSNFKEMLWSGPREAVKYTVPTVTKAATASAAVLTDTEPKADESWLEGTNAQGFKKAAEKKPESKRNGSKGKHNKAGTKSNGSKSGKTVGTRFSYLQEMQDMLTDSSEENGDSTSSASEDEMESASEGRISSDGDIRETEEINTGIENMQMKDNDKTEIPSVGRGPNPMYDMSKVNESSFKNDIPGFDDDMGLDDFSLPGLSAHAKSNKPAPKESTSEEEYENSYTFHKPTAQVVPNIPRPQMPPPFGIKYHFTLACRKCFNKIKEGHEGYVYKERLPHQCLLDILLVKDKTDPEAKWVKIRPRPNINYQYFTGKFRLCQQFFNDQACKIGEPFCTFAHSDAEAELWLLELNGMLDLTAFVHDQTRFRLQMRNARAATSVANQQSYPNTFQQQPFKKDFQQIAFPQPQNRPQIPRYQADSSGIRKLPNEQEEQFTQQYRFPLSETHEFRLGCPECCQQTNILGVFQYLPHQHPCKENMLMIRKKGDDWWLTCRERKNHRYFPGEYAICVHYTGSPPKPCTVGVDYCAFAHNKIEQYLWTLEKDGEFNIQEFIIQNRNEENQRGFTPDDFFNKHGGIFRFICHTCFYNQPCRISMQSETNLEVCNGPGHVWVHNKLLLHINHQKKATPIDARPFTHDTAFFLICHKLNFCRKRAVGECKFAHSQIERDLWMVERDCDMTREQLVEASTQFYMNYLNAQSVPGSYTPPAPAATPTPTTSTTSSMDTGPPPAASTVSPAMATARSSLSSFSSVAEASSTIPVQPKITKPPYRVIEVCGLCLKRGHKATQEGNKDRCNSKTQQHNNFLINKAYLILEANKELRRIPTKQPVNNKYIICQHIRDKKKCNYKGTEGCQFAHCEEEKEMWSWMSQNNVRNLEQVAQICKKAHEAAVAASKLISQGQSVVSAKPTTMPTHKAAVLPLDIMMSAYYCKYCSVQCNSQKQWDAHCASERHMFNVNSDKEHQWNFRPPPWGLSSSNYQLCADHVNEGRCRYSDKPDMYNYCKFAHSNEELDEWKERWEWRQMKREIAKREQVYSYMEALLEDYEEEYSGINVIAENLEGVQVECPKPLSLYEQNKNVEMTWSFIVKPKKGEKLEKVSLLHNKDRLHFCLVGNDLDKLSQIAPGSSFVDDNSAADKVQYKVEVRFTGGMFGSFMQWITFDFGSRPVLVRKLNVELGVQIVQEKVQQLRKQLDFFRWTGDNREIVRFDDNTTQHDQLLLKYKAPTSADMVITQQSIGVELNRHNYVHKMHKLLQLEELTRQQIISSYNLKVYIELQNRINESTLVCARPGELFAKVPLEGQLSEDTDAGKLILSSVFNVLIAPHSTDGKTVYEAVIVQKENFNFDGKGKDYIYLCLSPKCVKNLGLRNSQTIGVEIQFQMNRLPFCQMHHAVNQLEDTDIVFPDLSKIRPFLHEIHSLVVTSDILNEDQMKIVRHVMAERLGYSPPMIIYGPFGTGKTETMAQATMLLMKERPQARILICTHSNSAADLYIVKHLDAYVNAVPSARVLRVYSVDRRVNTVSMTIRKYCLLQPGAGSFEAPTREDIVQCQVVITTLNTSLQFSNLNLKGHFTHIFLDEAAQAFECETIMPLLLAIDTTCIVMAGDHMQISPKVYSSEAQRQKFQKSLLERLFRHYKSYSRHLDSRHPLNVLLSQNYRSKMEILRFISAIFYGGPDRLQAKSVQPAVDGLVPLNFYVAQGQEHQDRESTSFYNTSEIEEITARVEELYSKWPEEWGEPQPDSIGVVTPYYDQVLKIRSALRQRRRELREVVVERVMNMQGKEFRALFISTVRTRHLIENPPQTPRGESAECDGEGSDFGFLSDQKLLNTALTRARSFVAVVGDPVALCCIGDCTTIWRTYLKHCQQMGSIHPRNITIDQVRTQVISLMNSPHGQNLSRLANVGMINISTASQQITAPSLSSVQPGTSYSSAAQAAPATVPEIPAAKPLTEAMYQQQLGALPGLSPSLTQTGTVSPTQNIGPIGKPVYAHASLPPMSQTDDVDDIEFELRDYALEGGYFDDAILHIRLGSDEILKQLAKRAYKTSQKTNPSSPRALPTPIDFKLENVRIVAVDQQAVIQYKMAINVADESEIFDDKQMEPRAYLYQDYGFEQFKELMNQRPDKYKRCILHMDEDRIYAQVVDMNTDLKEIKISGISYCGQAFAKDEVVVEVETQTAEELENKYAKGQVVGILRRSVNPAENLIVCTVDKRNSSLMIPLNPNIPRMTNLVNSNQAEHVKNEKVCVYRINETQIKPHHYEPVLNGKAERKLFVVQHIGCAKFSSPVCVVVGVLQGADSMDSLMKVISIEYPVQTRFNADALMELNSKFPEGQPLPRTAFGNRVNYKERETFILRSPTIRGQNMALSIEMLQDNNLLLGVHTVDMTYFVKPDSQLDMESHDRATTVTVDDQVLVSMLPERLRNELCVVKTNEEFITISVFLSVNQVGEVQKVQPARCVIQPKFELTYKEAESIIDGTGGQSPYMIQVFMLHKIAQMWRKKRLGIASTYEPSCPTLKQTPNAYQLVEEVMITVNCIVARVLLERYPDCTPLLRQLKPSENILQIWKDKNMPNAINSISLQWPFMDKSDNEKVIFPISNNGQSEYLGMALPQWNKLVSAIERADIEELQQIVTAPEKIPQLAVAKAQLDHLIEDPRYTCSSEGSSLEKYYTSLMVPLYIQFTAPLHNYMDIVVQRMLTTVIDNRRDNPYTESEMEALTYHQTKAVWRAEKYGKAIQAKDVLTYMQCKPFTVYPFVQKLDGHSVHLRFPVLTDMLSDLGELLISNLGIANDVVYNEETGSIQLMWRQRIYDANGEKNTATKSTDVAELNPQRFIVELPAILWRELLATLNKDDKRPAIEVAAKIKTLARVCAEDVCFAEDRMSSLRCSDGSSQHYAQLGLSLKMGAVLKVQLAAQLERGILRPNIQLISVTPTFDVCVEHRRCPGRCFVKKNGVKAGKTDYSSVEEYRNEWISELESETVAEAVRGESIVIHNVAINWLPDHTDSSVSNAMFQLPMQFCTDRMIRFLSLEQNMSRTSTEQCLGYVCVRYKGLTIPSTVDVPHCLASETDATHPVCWVGHCIATAATVDQMTGQMVVSLKLQHSVIPLPDILLTQQMPQPQMCATIEWMPKPVMGRRIELALDLLGKSSPLAKDIAVGKHPPALDDNSYQMLVQAQQMNPSCIVQLDSTQERAIECALKNRFSVIRGYPGSGKTVTAVRLAQLFVEANRTVPPLQTSVKKGMKPQVLICASNDKSLDIIALYLKQLGRACPKLVRVYSEDIEQEEYPLPMEPTKPRQRHGTAVIPEMRDIALHYIIREEDCVKEENRRYATMLKDAEKTGQTQYVVQLLNKLQYDELSAAEIILCTCGTSGAYRIFQSTHIRQVLIDDAGMCIEPECMIPIICSGAQQVVLIGDEKELSPWPRDGSTQRDDHCLKRSLLQRYSTRAQVILNYHYRMHEGVAAFPSEHTYNCLMVCGKDDQAKPSSLKIWPNGKNKPIAFVHVTGIEKRCTAATSTGSYFSISNGEQVNAVVKIAMQLTLRSHVRPKDVAILTVYLTQCGDIRRALCEKSSGDIEVLPVDQSQGSEWDYVILCTVRSRNECDIDVKATADWQERYMGILTDEQFINMALTRARKGLLIVGDKYLLKCNPTWKTLLRHYEVNKKVLDLHDFISQK